MDDFMPEANMIACDEKGSSMDEEQNLEKEIRELEVRLKDRELALPAHSVRPHQLLIIEELEEEIQEKKNRLAALRK
jgi:hypothetical protein